MYQDISLIRKMHSQINQLYNPLLGYVHKRVRNREDAEDLTQDVFLKLSSSNKEGVNNLKSWIYTIAKNTITDYYRKKQIVTESVADDYGVEEEDENEAAQELATCVRAYIDQLPEEYRELMILSELKDIPQKEIAKQLNMNYVTVRSKIQRGRKKLRGLFEDCCVILQGGKGSIMGYQERNTCDEPCDSEDC